MRGQDHVVQAEIRRILQRLLAEDIEGGPGHLAGAQGLDQGCIVDQLAAGAVDDAHVLPHRGQRRGVDNPRGLRGKPHVQGQIIGAAK